MSGLSAEDRARLGEWAEPRIGFPCEVSDALARLLAAYDQQAEALEAARVNLSVIAEMECEDFEDWGCSDFDGELCASCLARAYSTRTTTEEEAQ